MTRLQLKVWVVITSLALTSGSAAGEGNACDGHPCGKNTNCEDQDGKAMCSCIANFIGDPLKECVKGECSGNDDCATDKTCVKGKCEMACPGSCGTGSDCAAKNHIPICSCPSGTSGDPFESCEKIDLCIPNPCGIDAICQPGHDKAGNDRPVCTCPPGYLGNALQYCRRGECQTDDECRNDQVCDGRTFQCSSPCNGQCGVDAICTARNHRALCSCPPGYMGNALVQCRRGECQTDEECRNDQICDGRTFQCTSPCKGQCGVSAICTVRNHRALCSCPPGYMGDALQYCRRGECQTDEECRNDQICDGRTFQCTSPCKGQCGVGATCTARNHRALCSCPPGYMGDALQYCRRGECQADEECRSDQYCDRRTFKCTSPCTGQCGVGATCEVRNHRPLCSCPPGYMGDASQYCRRGECQVNEECRSDQVCDGRTFKCISPCSGQCGVSATCMARNHRALCSCPPGYLGDASQYCRRGECQVDEECRNDQICDRTTFKCIDPCSGLCGVGAICKTRNHRASCACPSGYTGDAIVSCSSIPNSLANRRAYSRYYYYDN